MICSKGRERINKGQETDKNPCTTTISHGDFEEISFMRRVTTNIRRHQWLTLVILATQEAEIRRIEVQSQPKQIVRPYLKNTHHKKGLVKWLRVYTLSSNPSTTKEKKSKHMWVDG
jgi:hypothetical protein